MTHFAGFVTKSADIRCCTLLLANLMVPCSCLRRESARGCSPRNITHSSLALVQPPTPIVEWWGWRCDEVAIREQRRVHSNGALRSRLRGMMAMAPSESSNLALAYQHVMHGVPRVGFRKLLHSRAAR